MKYAVPLHKTLAWLTVSGALLSGCTTEDLTRLEHFIPRAQKTTPFMASAHVDACTRKSQIHTDNTKYIFILDKSGSNQVNYPATPPYTPLHGTDPDGSRRYGSTLSFLTNSILRNSSNLSFSLINFATTPTLVQRFTSDVNAFSGLLSSQQAATVASPSSDGGWTDYMDTLTMVKNLIESDAQVGGNVSYHYVVFWLSDGAPWMPISAPPYEQLQDNASILGLVQSIYNLQQTYNSVIASVQFHTAYYHYNSTDYDPVADSLMQHMADAGGGKHFNISEGETLDLSRFPIFTRLEAYDLQDILIRNTNMAFDPDNILTKGKAEKDTDGSGMTDTMKKKLGANPLLSDSDANGVSDLVEMTVFGSACNDPACSPLLSRSFPSCKNFEISGSSPMAYTNSAGDATNDCERALLGIDPNSPTAPGSWMPVSLVLAAGLVPQTAASSLSLDPYGDQMTNYQKIKVNLPVFVSMSKIPDVTPYDYELQQVSSDETQTCYHLDVNNITTSGGADAIRVYFLEGGRGDNRHWLRSAIKPLGTDNNVSFSDSDFPYQGQ